MKDVNGSRHHLFLGHEDWRDSIKGTDGGFYDRDREVVTLEPDFVVLPDDDPAVEIEDRRGAARDRYGNWYWIGPKRQSVQVRWSGAGEGAHYWSASDPHSPCRDEVPGLFKPVETPPASLPEDLCGLSVTTTNHNMLVVGSPETESLLVFDLHSGGGPSRVALPSPPNRPEGTKTEPFDIAPLSGEYAGGIVVLDRENKLLWELDASFHPRHTTDSGDSQPLLFQPVDVTERERYDPQPKTAHPIELDPALNESQTPISVETIADGTFLVLVRDETDDRDQAEDFLTLWRYNDDGISGLEVGRQHLSDLKILGRTDIVERIQGHDMAFVPGDEERDDTLYVVDAGGNQAFALTVTLHDGLEVAIQSPYYPLRSYTNKALVTPPGTRDTYFDQGERWTKVIDMDRPNYHDRAEIFLPTLDGYDLGCVWHRICIDACIPPETEVRVYTRTADDEEALQWQSWEPEPELYKRPDGTEMPYYTLWSKDALKNPNTGTWELLFQQARGRYLEIALELTGNMRATPAIRALRAHYPRFSYLTNYLPNVYQEDGTSADLLDRFLANSEGLLTKLEGWIAEAQTLFDVRSTPSEALEWLAAWLGLALDPTWTDYQRRLLIAHAPEFYQRRGTMTGIMQSIRLAIDPAAGPEIFQGEYQEDHSDVRIVERYRTRHVPATVAGDPTFQDVPTDEIDPIDVARARAHQFVVLLPHWTTDAIVALVERLVKLEKPAFTYFSVRRYYDMFRVGEVRLGLDTRLGESPDFTPMLLGQTGLAEGDLGTTYPFDLTGRVVVAD